MRNDEIPHEAITRIIDKRVDPLSEKVHEHDKTLTVLNLIVEKMAQNIDKIGNNFEKLVAKKNYWMGIKNCVLYFLAACGTFILADHADFARLVRVFLGGST